MTNIKHIIRRLGVAALSVVWLAPGGCGSTSSDDGGVVTATDRFDWLQTAQLALASDCSEAERFFREAAITQMELELESNRRCWLDDGGCMWRLAAGEDSNGEEQGVPSNDSGDDATPDEWSETNTQVEGVDEADFVKNTGTRIYALFGHDLVIMKSWPAAETAELGRVSIKGWPSSFYLYEDKVVALSSANYYDLLPQELREDDGEGAYRNYWRQVTLVTVIDISDETAPVIAEEHVMDGLQLSSRRIDEHIYLAQVNHAWIDGLKMYPDIDRDARADEINAAFDAMRAHNVAVIEALPLSHWLPNRYPLGADGTFDPSAGEPITSCDAVYRPNVYAGRQVLSVVTFDLDDDSIHGSSIVGDWGNVYASLGALYIGTSNWNYYWWWETSDDADVPALRTQIHKFAFGEDGDADYVASGSVLGYAINQFAFDEHDGALRVATTDGFGWWNTSETTESRVTVLEQRGAALQQVGMVAGLGEGERIYSVRFRGDKGYVVTFREVDPLYVIDLADATNPTVLGELKVPGYSSYIHPMDPGHLLTIGRDADDDGAVRGLQFQIFDVTDPTSPQATHKTLIGDSWRTWSDAIWDHHAFVYYPARDLLAVPVSGWDPDDGMGYWHYRSAVFLFHVTVEDGIELLGSVTHVPLLEDLGVNTTCRSWNGWWAARVRRGVFVEDYLYTLSNLGIRVHDTRDMAAGPVAAELCIDPADFNGGHTYYDPCYEVEVDEGAGG